MKNVQLKVIVVFALVFCLSTVVEVFAVAPSNDNFADAAQVSGDNGTTTGTNVDATAETGEPNHGSGDLTAYASVWFKWTAPVDGLFIFNTFGSDFDTVLAAYTGAAVNNLTLVASNDDAGLGYQSQINFTAAAGTTYYIAVDGYYDTEQGGVVLNWGTPAPSDNFIDAIQLPGSAGTSMTNNLEATAETGEPIHRSDGSTAYVSVWFKWTASADGDFVFHTFGSGFDTVLAAYTGAAVNNLTLVVSNDDAGSDVQSQIVIPATSGITYYIVVDGYDDTEQGYVVLNWGTPAPSDNFVDATQLSGSAGTLTTSNFGATAETGEPIHRSGGSTAYVSIWFKWTAPADADVVFDTFGSDFDTVLAAYTGTAVDSLTLVVSNDDAGSGLQSQINFTAAAGTTYYIAVDGYDDTEQGGVVLTFRRRFPWPSFLPAIVTPPAAK